MSKVFDEISKNTPESVKEMVDTVFQISELERLLLRLTFKHFVSRCKETGLIWVRVCPQEYDTEKPDFDIEFINAGYELVNVAEVGDALIEFAYQKSK